MSLSMDSRAGGEWNGPFGERSQGAEGACELTNLRTDRSLSLVAQATRSERERAAKFSRVSSSSLWFTNLFAPCLDLVADRVANLSHFAKLFLVAPRHLRRV